MDQLRSPLGGGLYHNPFSRLGIPIGDKGIGLDWFVGVLSHGSDRGSNHHYPYPMGLT